MAVSINPESFNITVSSPTSTISGSTTSNNTVSLTPTVYTIAISGQNNTSVTVAAPNNVNVSVSPNTVYILNVPAQQGLAGPQGPIGPQGSQGEVGPQGPQGIQGPAGTSTATYTTLPNAEAFTIQPGQPVYLTSEGGVMLAQATAIGTHCQGIASTTASSGEPINVLFDATLSLSDWTAPTGGTMYLTPGTSYYLSVGAPGILSSIPGLNTGQIFQYIGVAINSTTLFVAIQPPYIS